MNMSWRRQREIQRQRCLLPIPTVQVRPGPSKSDPRGRKTDDLRLSPVSGDRVELDMSIRYVDGCVPHIAHRFRWQADVCESFCFHLVIRIPRTSKDLHTCKERERKSCRNSIVDARTFVVEQSTTPVEQDSIESFRGGSVHRDGHRF